MDSLLYIVHLFNSGGLVMYPLVILSIIVIAIGIERYTYFKANTALLKEFSHDVYFAIKDNDWKKRLGVVFSTASDYDYQTDAEEEVQTLEAKSQKLRVRIEKNGRGGKTVTIVSGFVGREDDLKELGKALKSKCGVGGSAKDGEVLVQGDFRQRVIEILRAMGYSQTK